MLAANPYQAMRPDRTVDVFLDHAPAANALNGVTGRMGGDQLGLGQRRLHRFGVEPLRGRGSPEPPPTSKSGGMLRGMESYTVVGTLAITTACGLTSTSSVSANAALYEL